MISRRGCSTSSPTRRGSTQATARIPPWAPSAHTSRSGASADGDLTGSPGIPAPHHGLPVGGLVVADGSVFAAGSVFAGGLVVADGSVFAGGLVVAGGLATTRF